MSGISFLIGAIVGIIWFAIGLKVYKTFVQPKQAPRFTAEDKELLERLRKSHNAVRLSHNRVLEVLDHHGWITYAGTHEDIAKLEV